MIRSPSRRQLTDTILEIPIPQPETQHTTPKLNRGKGIASYIDESPRMLVKASSKVHLNPNAPKAAKEAKLLEMNKSELIKVVHGEAAKARVDPKILASVKGGYKFRKIQDAEIKVLYREHSEKIRKARELRKKRIDQYRWAISSRHKPETITDIHIHLHTKPIIVTVFRGNDRKNFDVFNPFKFGDFGVIELDELGLIIQKKKNKVVGDLMTSLGKRFSSGGALLWRRGVLLLMLTNKGWVDSNGSNLGGGFQKPGGGRETRGGGDGLERPDG
ncbi:hypothetical protein Tco_1214278 [Tanacetum coccineum]